MKTYNIDFDLSQATPQSLNVDLNTDYMLCIRLYDKSGEHMAWDGGDGDGNVLIAVGDYMASYDYVGNAKTVWHNPAEKLSTIHVENNKIYVKMPAVESSQQYTLLINNSGTALQNIPTSSTEVAETSENTAMPWRMSQLRLYVKPNSNVSENPAVGGILLEGEYEDGTEFSFSIPGVENEIRH